MSKKEIAEPVKKDALVPPNAAIGQAILDEAKKQHDEKRKARVIASVEGLLASMHEAEETIRRGQMMKDFLSRQVVALNKGEFEFTDGGITFNEKELNQTQPKGYGKPQPSGLQRQGS